MKPKKFKCYNLRILSAFKRKTTFNPKKYRNYWVKMNILILIFENKFCEFDLCKTTSNLSMMKVDNYMKVYEYFNQSIKFVFRLN
jgi:hypothetical protein